jgi:hypothetical protein
LVHLDLLVKGGLAFAFEAAIKTMKIPLFVERSEISLQLD